MEEMEDMDITEEEVEGEEVWEMARSSMMTISRDWTVLGEVGIMMMETMACVHVEETEEEIRFLDLSEEKEPIVPTLPLSQ
jgi:hypothetical protein